MSKEKKYSRVYALLLMGVIEAIVIMLLVYLAEPTMAEVPDPLRLPLIVLFGVIAFLGALTIAASLLKCFDLSNPLEALGLPSGSVRALIALSLILIFALMVIFMANNLGRISEYEYPANSTVIYGDKNYTNPNGNITILLEPSKAAVDFSMQVLTTVSTLVVALAGFYFGTKSVAQAQKSTEPPEASLSTDPKSPATLDLGKSQELVIIVTTTPENELIGCRVENTKNGTISSEKPNEFKYTPSDEAKETKEAIQVTLLFWMVKYRGDLKELKVNIIPKKTQK